MKSLKSLIVVAALVFWACSEDTKDTTGVWVDDPTMAYGESSSSLLVSSSDVEGVSSSSINTDTVDIGNYGESPIFFPPGELCKPAAPGSAGIPKRNAPKIKEDESYGVIPAITKERVKVLVAYGLPLDSAISQARTELFIELGLDSLLEETAIYESSLERTLYYVYKYLMKGNVLYEETEFGIDIATDFADGKLDGNGMEGAREFYCLTAFSYEEFADIGGNFMPMGCFISSRVYNDPFAILSNIKRKCEGLPFCGKDRVGEFSEDGSLVCKKYGWSAASPLDVETAGRPCEKEGEYFVSALDSKRSYICHVKTGWDSISTLQVETAGRVCRQEGEIFKSPLLSNVTYVCRDTSCSPSDEYSQCWEYGGDFEMEVVSIPCDEIGKMMASVVKPDSFHICKEYGWATANLLEMDTVGHVCELDGSRFDSPRVSGLFYICQDGVWSKFYDMPCKTDNERLVIGDETDGWNKQTYICYGGKWYSSFEWTTDLPYEYYFNPDIDYGTFTDSRDGHVYRTVEYLGKTWMAENMKYYDPEDIHVKNQIACLEDSCANTGFYYSTESASYVCPAGWSLPDTATARLLTDYRHYYSNIATIGGGHNYQDDFGLSFTATGLIAGENLDDPGWLGFATMFWLKELDDTGIHYIENVIGGHERGPTKFEDIWGVNKENAHFPIRCVKE